MASRLVAEAVRGILVKWSSDVTTALVLGLKGWMKINKGKSGDWRGNLVAAVLLVLPHVCVGQVDDAYYTPSGEGFIYLLLMVFFLFNFIVPPARLLYDRFLKGFINKAAEKAREVQAQVMERINDAQRKVSDRMTAV